MNAPPSAALAPSPVPSAGTAAPLRERLAATPRLACDALARAINCRDLEGALECFSPGACLITPDATAVHGEASIRTILSQLVESRTEISIELAGVLAAADLALAHERWTIRSGSRGSPFAQASHPTLVLRQLGGEWKVAIAAPWGWDAAPPLEAVWP
jgi:ketosteroid isomerase-like protein